MYFILLRVCDLSLLVAVPSVEAAVATPARAVAGDAAEASDSAARVGVTSSVDDAVVTVATLDDGVDTWLRCRKAQWRAQRRQRKLDRVAVRAAVHCRLCRRVVVDHNVSAGDRCVRGLRSRACTCLCMCP